MGRRACLCVCVCCLGRNVWVGGGFVHVLRMFVSVCGWKVYVCVGVRCEAAELSRRLSPLSGVCRSWKPDTRCLQSSSYPRIPCHPSPHVYSISCERGTEQLWSLCVIIFCVLRQDHYSYFSYLGLVILTNLWPQVLHFCLKIILRVALCGLLTTYF